MNFASEGTPPDPTKNARKRMLRDIIEWNQYSDECPMVTAAPMQENIFEWHINMNATSGVLKNIIIHLVATFPPDYPKQPPIIQICSFFPHPNVFAKYYYYWDHKWVWRRDKQHYYICLDMLRRYKDESARDKKVILDSYHGWSAAYSVTSVLVQLSSFLYEHKSSFYQSNIRTHMRGKKGMKMESQAFSCMKCGHSYNVPYPPLSPHRPKNKSKQRKLKKRKYAQEQKQEALEYIVIQIEGHNNDEDFDETLQLQLLQGRYKESKRTQRLRNIQKQKERNNVPNGTLVKRCTNNMWLFLYDDVERLIVGYLSLRDLMKLSTVSIYHQKLVENTKLLQLHRFGCWYHRVDLRFHHKLLEIRGRFHGWNEEAMLQLKSKSNESNREVYNLTLGYGIIATFYEGGTSFGSHIHCDDLAAMQQAEDALNMIEGKESSVSGINIGKRFSRNALDFPLLKEVKATFDLLSTDAYLNHNIHTTAWNDQSFHNFVPIYINNNHGERALDCLEEFVLQCYSKHDASIRIFHPLMAIHLIANIMNSLVVHLMHKVESDKGQFAYGVVTDAFNTANNGAGYHEYQSMNTKQKEKNCEGLNLHYSIKVLESYFHFHHLLLGVYRRYYSILQPVVEKKCIHFIGDSEYRMKQYVPNLGEMMVWLTLNHLTWTDACSALLDELFIRHVKWVLMECPQLFKVSNKLSCIRLHKTFEYSTTSLRLFCFQYFFLKSCCNIGNVSPMDKLKQYNDNFGCPPAALPYELQKWCRTIYGITDYFGFFDLIDIPCPCAQSLCKWLEYAVIESERRGYHKNCDVDLLSHLKKVHYQSTQKIFTSNQLNDEWCLCSAELNRINAIETIQIESRSIQSKKLIFADIIIIKYVGFKKEYPNWKDLQQRVNQLIGELQTNSRHVIHNNVRYKLIVANHGEDYMDGTKWVKDLNAVFAEYKEENIKRELYLWDDDAEYYNAGVTSKYFNRVHAQKESIYNHEWRASAQKYIIDLDVLSLDGKALILPFTLLETEGDQDSDLYLNQTVKADDIIYYITMPQILQIHEMPWNEWILTPYCVNLDGLLHELSSIYQSFRDRKMLPIISELFEQFKARNPNIAANAHSTNIFKLFRDDCCRGRKNQIVRKHFRGSLVWYSPHYKVPYADDGKDNDEYYCKQVRLHLKYSDAMYCGEIIKFHDHKSGYQERFYEIKPRYPKYIPTEDMEEEWIATHDDHIAIKPYAAIAVSDAVLCTVMAQRGYNLTISDILPFHAKHSEICPIQHCYAELKYIKEREMSSYLHKKRGKRMDGLSEPEIIQFAMNRKEITSYLMNFTLFKQAMEFTKARENRENWDNDGCIYRDRKYCEYYADARNAMKLSLPPFQVPQFDPFEMTSSFLYRDYDDADNSWPQFDALPVQAYDESTHRWFNAKIIKFESISAIVEYDEWNKFVFREKISLIRNKLVPYNTYLIEDNKCGYMEGDNTYAEEYEAKEKKQKRFDDKFNLLNDEYYHKYFFEAVADNNIKIVKQLLLKFNDNEKIATNHKLNKKSKWTPFNCNLDTDWLKWMNRKIDVNMTDTGGRTPLFVCAYYGYWKMYKLLIEGDIDIQVIDLHGQTALDAGNAGLLNANTQSKTKCINKIIHHLKANMKQYPEGHCIRPNINGPIAHSKNEENDDSLCIIPGNKARRNIGNNETIWSSSLVYIGNLPWKMREQEIEEFVHKFDINPSQVIKRTNYTLIRTREDLATLNKKIEKLNGIFFRGAMITVNLFERNRTRNNDNKQSRKSRSLSAVQHGHAIDDDHKENISRIAPNRALFVNNFDIKPGIYDCLNAIFKAFGDLLRDIHIGVDKCGDPFAKIVYINLDDAIKLYKEANAINALNRGIKVGLRILRVQYSKFNHYDIVAREQYPTPKHHKHYPTPKQRKQYPIATPNQDGSIRSKQIKAQQRRKKQENTKWKHKKAMRIGRNENKNKITDDNMNTDDCDGWIVKGRKAKKCAKSRKVKYKK